ncbi:MAG: phosphatase PAP2 family protein [Agarilytica sp.]
MQFFPNTKVGFAAYVAQTDPVWLTNGKHNNILLYAAIVCLSLGAVLLFIGGLQTGFLPSHKFSQTLLPATAWENITFVGDTATALAIALLFTYKHPRLTLGILFSALVGTLLIHGLKNLIDTPRPPAVFSSDVIQIIGPSFKRLSMPSGHTATAFILAGALTQCTGKLSLKFSLIAVACLIGYSRIACGVHWPADVLMGACLGLCSAWAGLYFSNKVSLNFFAYLFVVFLLMVSAVYLFSFDGGFESTQYTAPLIGLVCLFYFLGVWGWHIRRTTK